LYSSRQRAAASIRNVVYRALAAAASRPPASVQGAFILAGNVFDALAAIGKVLACATRDVLIVDPYMDERALTDFAPLALERVGVRLLADAKCHKPTLRAAAERWSAQYGTSRPLAVRLAPARTLHDRLIILDDADAWLLTQSLNAFARRSPASISRTNDEIAALKVAAYQVMWANASDL
jgi:hypothetical protein